MRRTCLTIALTIALLGPGCSKSGPTAATNMGPDDQHKLYQAAINARDAKLIQQVTETLGLSDSNGSPKPAYAPFIKEHADWASRNFDFVKEYIAPDKAKEYVRDHLPQ
ncbi:MAG TPA: hypothetical protein VEV81_16330 [Pyrinomonadaceae bacterium]|nr:hypothetical protein [Pyrinomonadaceae bacterium]